jgi:hypothetical protein
MHRLVYVASFVLAGCGGPSGMMAATDADDSSSGTSGDSTDGSMTSTNGATVGMTNGSTASTTEAPTTTMTSTTMTTSSDPDTSTTDDPTGDTTTDACPPGTEGCPCDIGSTCDGELLCEAGTCVVEPACDEPEGEPNDDEPSAVQLETAICGADPIEVAGGFDGAESDWFVFFADDQIACFSEPTIEVEAAIDVAVCAFVSCAAGATDVTCQSGADESDSPDGLSGCCDQGGLDFGFNCGLAGSNADIFVRLTSVDAECTPYTFTYVY